MKNFRTLVLWAVLIAPVPVALSVAAESSPTHVLTIEQAIKIADATIADGGARPSNVEIVFVRKYSTAWNDFAPRDGKTARIRELHDKLTGRTYWLVSYAPRPMTLGGTVAVFVDDSTGESIVVVRGK